MDILNLLSLLVYTFGAFAFGAMGLVWVQKSRQDVRVGRRPPPGELAGAVLTLVSFAWFVVCLLLVLAPLSHGVPRWTVQVASLVLALLFPPLIMHAFYAELRGCRGGAVAPAWGAVLALAYVASQSVSLFCLLAIAGVVPLSIGFVSRFANASLGLLFIVAAIYSTLTLARSRPRQETVAERASRRGFAILLFVLALIAGALVLNALAAAPFAGILELTARSMPLLFLSVGTYYGNRYEFFDLFVKRGAALLVTVGVLTVSFAMALPVLERFDLSWARPWVYGIVFLPVVGALPWLCGRLYDWLDAAWLGRRFTIIEAVKYFLTGLQDATSEAALADRAAGRLAEIFRAPARVDLGPDDEEPAFATAAEAAVTVRGEHAGRMHLGPRGHDTPFFSEDVALLSSLAGVFASVLENIRLQQRRQEQDQRAADLMLQAERSRLTALRARIDPHFLFNALNTIAGLIHRDPARADRAVEQLAEVFRYALRRSDSEWVALEDELEFARAYLEVQQARFGDRLQFDVSAEGDEVKDLKVPVMMIQTLVENAVKHGVSGVRGPGVVQVRARWLDGRLRIDIADSGPGFAGSLETATGPEERDAGYGLTNVRERLAGYFGGQALLRIDRDHGRGLTVVSIEMPASAPAGTGVEPGAPPARGARA
jgi:anti-sigma regulatory factor (Ser/Thr protein kinase)